MLIVLFS